MTTERTPELCEVMPKCPLCDGKMETVYNRFTQQVCVCVDCRSGITVRGSTWKMIRLKREGKWEKRFEGRSVITVQSLANKISNIALKVVFPSSENREPERRHDAPALTSCPICDGQMDVAYHRNNKQVLVCLDCRAGLTVPGSAWDIVRIKKQKKRVPKPP